MVKTCPFIQGIEKNHLGCTDAYTYRYTWRGLKRNFIPFWILFFFFFLDPCSLAVMLGSPFKASGFPWISGSVCQKEAGGLHRALRHCARMGWGWGETLLLLHSLHVGLYFFSFLFVPVAHLSKNILFLFQGEKSKLFSST